jgi:hypothetical protein
MPALLDQLIQDHGDEITHKISSALGVTREQAASVLSATAPIILNRFDGGKSFPESDAAPAGSLDSPLDGTGQQMNARIQGELGFTPEQAAKVIPLLVPIVLRFLMRRLPYGNAAVPIISSFVQKQGNGSLDELALRLARKCTPSPDSPGIPTLLGRWAGKYFPSGR